MTRRRAAVACLALCALSACTEAPPQAPQPERYARIVTLAPNLTELAFTAGAGNALVGVSAWSDYPTPAKLLPVIGDAFMIDRERLAILQPDLLLAWQGGTPAHVVDELRAAGFAVEVLNTDSLADVPTTLRRIGELAGSGDVANLIADEFSRAIDDIARRYRDASGIRVFYQVSRRPLYTINGRHYVSELIELCGGQNVFAELAELAPTVDVEAVIDRDPEVLLASSDAGDDAFSDWSRWPDVAASRHQNFFLLPADSISRATTRLVHGADAMCKALDEARRNRDAGKGE